MSSRSPFLFGGLLDKHAVFILMLLIGMSSCSPQKTEVTGGSPDLADPAIIQVGSIRVSESDLAQYLKEQEAGRTDEETKKRGIKELASRAQLVQAALDANLDRDPIVRAEFARILANRLKEQQLFPKLKSIAAPLPETRLRELYKADESRFRSNEKRQAAVLWLNPGKDENRVKQYEQKLVAARDWYFKSSDLAQHPEQGFSMLGVDHSEHQSSRYNGGVLGWLEREGGMDDWTKAVADIVFSLDKPGDVSEVIVRNEGVFLVRYMALNPAFLRPFESVSEELEKAEINRMRQQATKDFMDSLAKEYPVQNLLPPSAGK
ncbi:parvulin-like peptidyl-prolyl cis-trans isomerase protein [Prosthecobacter fusiformis]|uniref:Parvulin-like peptidyl-prolyl cis-trans isomerase protein n=1 Tax=Prosthecobacter fusiformis TaxID=48464 RepID=A0A4R7RZ67_9BACT|nr:peptidylprolyl isomerase [Prosthecobacter fusiformis]TDU70689.1 parvulin-like peptidyl-prolyl cis-trans isomerase protein [Prosthecobacter fusiformis]